MKELASVMKIITLEKKDIWLSIVFGFLAGIAAVGLFGSSGYLISRAALVPPLYALTVLIAFLKLFGFARALGRYAERYYSHRATFTMLSNIRLAFYKKIEPHAPRIFQKYRSGDLLSRIVGDVESLQNFFLRVYYPPVVMVVIFLATIVFTTIFSWAVALVLFVGLLLTGLIIPFLFALRQRKLENEIREARGHLSTDVTEFLYGFRDLKIYQQLEDKEEQLESSAATYIHEQERQGKQMVYSQSVNTLATLIVSWVVTGLGAYLVGSGDLNGLFLAMLVMISLTVFENAAPMAVLPRHLDDSRRASKRLFHLEEAVEESEETEPLSGNAPYGYRFDHVSFRYEEASRPSLDDVSIELAPGTKTAVVGPSGSGKSTLMQLLLKVYPQTVGDVTLDGKPLAKVDEEDLWSQANVVLQENHFFYGTIRDNLSLAKDDVSDEEMTEALAKAELAAFSLDDEVFERGENLSGGEKQRLAMARALLRNERLWLLDEPTSSIDALTEQSLYRHLFEQAKDDTLVLISHRLTGLEQMDQIIVMEQGKVVETGTYDELMAQQGYFYQMKQIEKSVFG
ncbi:thiol reductant ABC exporter subunit CydC [Halobacillus litoralis]|uniref:thiol reductant ABC exporter subunit CydC n=1 Tax=Halobacillus litoralis TaxID=45668 RepID=UPI001CD44AD6|nr:thiol reductant ABC exporter subunit CydC [Halobacillus litoralis]MCA0972419.1 thiol reductant ABC exporter subunit CydC [Halobacillus litoralis]